MKHHPNRRTLLRGLAAVAGWAAFSGWHGEAQMSQRTPVDRGKNRSPIPLPKPTLRGKMSVEEAIARRRSVREFADQALAPEAIGQLLWAAEGITGEASHFRAHPSAGALHPLEVYLVGPDGMFHYRPRGHAVLLVQEGDRRAALARAALEQGCVADAPCIIVIAAVYARTTGKYGERGRARYVPMDAAHAAQNVLLQAVALGLGAVPVGAFDDEDVRRALGLPGEEVPLYLLPVGKAKA